MARTYSGLWVVQWKVNNMSDFVVCASTELNNIEDALEKRGIDYYLWEL